MAWTRSKISWVAFLFGAKGKRFPWGRARELIPVRVRRMSTRTAVLAHAGSPGAGMLTQIGAVPLTDTWIIKDVRISTSGTAAGNTQIYVTDVTGNDFGYLFNKNMAANELDTVSGFVVVPPGGQLWVHWQTNSQFVWVSGADLPGHI